MQQDRYQRYVIQTWLTMYTWGGTSWTSQTSQFHTSDVQTRRTAIGDPVSTPCFGSRKLGADGEPQQFLIAGGYVFSWGGTQVSFSVPADTQVELSWRVLASGVRAAVLIDDGPGEVLIHPGAGQAAGTRAADERSSALQSVEGSLTEAETGPSAA